MPDLRKTRTVLIAIVCCLAQVGLLPQTSNARQALPFKQGVPKGEESFEESLVDETSLFVAAPREVLRPFLRAQKAIENGEYERAVALIGESLSDIGSEDYLIRVPGEEGVAVSLRRRANDLLGKIPKRHRESYELRYGIRARQLLDRAVEAGDFLLMSQIVGSFFYTEAGYEAALLLGYYHLDQGRPLAAAFSFQRVVDVVDAREIHDPEASVLLATCWMLANSPGKAERVLIDLKRRRSDETIRFMDRDVPLFKAESDAIPWLKNLVGDSPLTHNRIVSDWVMYRGNPQRNARSGSGFPLPVFRWYLPTLNDLDLEKVAKQQQQEMIFADAAMIPSVQPIAVNDTIVMRTFDRMMGVDFKTGRRIWVFPSLNTDMILAGNESVEHQSPSNLNNSFLVSRMWQDSIFGQSSSDGRSIFVVPQPGFAGKSPLMSLQNNLQIIRPLAKRRYNELQAVDVLREGALKWTVGGKTGLDEPKLAEAFFLGAPLPLDGNIYAICQQQGEIRLVVLDPETGKLQWSRQLASVETKGSIVNLVDQRLAGATPSFSDGLLVCPTGVGAIVAVDITTRNLIWGFQYGTSNSKGATRLAPDQTSNSKLVNTRWSDSTVTLADGCVLYTPVDTNYLITLDLLTGRPLWQRDNVPRPWVQREDSLFVGCVERQHAILFGLDYVRSVDLETGDEAWRLYTGEYGRPSGQGYSNRGFYYLPMTSEQLIKIDLRQGTIAKAVRTDGVLGNLICHRGDVISHGVDHLAVYPQDEPNQKRIETAEKNAVPGVLSVLTSDQLAIKAQLLLQRDDLKAAATCISQAYDIQPKPAYEKILLEVITRLIRSDFELAKRVFSEYSHQFPITSQPRLQSAFIDGLIKQGSYQEAFELIVPLVESSVQGSDLKVYLNDVGQLANPDMAEPRSSHRLSKVSIRFDRWLESRLHFVLENSSEAQRADFSSRLNQLVIDSGHLPALLKYSLFKKVGFECIPAETAEELAKSLDKLNEKLRASELRNGLASLDVAPDGSNGESQNYLNGTIRESLRQRSNDLVQEWNTGLVTYDLVEATDEDFDQSRTMARNIVVLEENDNDIFDPFLFRFYGQTGEFEILDRYGKTVSKFSTRDAKLGRYAAFNDSINGTAKISGCLMTVNIANEVFAVDLTKVFLGGEPLLWSHDCSRGRPTGSIRHQITRNIWGAKLQRVTQSNSGSSGRSDLASVSSPNMNGICYLERSALTCVDPFSGEKLWQRYDIPTDSRLLSGEKIVIVWNAQTRTADTYDLLTGELKNQMKIPVSLGSRWADHGTNLLLSGSQIVRNPVENKALKQMTLVDAATGETVWQREYDEQTHASLNRNEKIAILSGNGTLQWVDFLTGRIQATTATHIPLDRLRQVAMIELKEYSTGYLLMLHCHSSSTYRHVNSSGVRLTGKQHLQFWNGYLVSVDRESFTPNWDGPARVQHFNLVPNQPYDSPLLLLHRRVDLPRGVRASRYWSQVVALDLRNGRTVANAITEYSSSRDYRVEVEMRNQTVAFFFRGKTLKFRITYETPPPRPVAQLTGDNSVWFKNTTQRRESKLVPISKESRDRMIARIMAQQERLEARRLRMRAQMNLQQDEERQQLF